MSKRHPLRAAVRRPTSPKGGGKAPSALSKLNDNLHDPAHKSGCPVAVQPLFIYFPQPQFPPQPLQLPEQEPLSGQPTHLTPFFRALRR